MTRQKKKALKKASIWTVTLAVLAAGGVFWWSAKAKGQDQPQPKLVEARRGALRVVVSATGTVEPEYVVEIKSRASGTVQKVTVQEGDRVSTGRLLVKLDPIVEQRRVNQAKAELRMAEARSSSAYHKVRFARAQLSRDRLLLKKGLVSKDAVDTRAKEANVLAGDSSVAWSQIAKAKETLKEAQDHLAETEIKAPVTGTVLERLVQPGQMVASGTNSVSGGTALLKIADLSKLFVRVKVDEADVAKLRVGQQVNITADALQRQSFVGQVHRIAPQGTIENNVTVFGVLVAVDERGSRALRPQMSANVEVVVTERPPAVLVSVRAVKRQGRRRASVTLADGTVKKVQIGLTVDGQTEILSGLKAGEQVQLPVRKATAKKGQRNSKRRGGTRNMRRMMGGRR